MADLFDDYPTGPAWDEMIDPDGGGSRTAYKGLHRALAQLSAGELRARAETLARSYLAQGVTFDFAGEERPFPLDVVPRVLAGDEWEHVAPGVAQRVRALEAFLADVYGPQRAIADGVIPRSVVVSSTNFLRAARGINPPNGVRVHVSGIDLVRDSLGGWRVLEDNVRVPSGVSYVLSNRRAMAQTFPELFAALRIRPVADYPRRLLAALTAAAPSGVDEPTVVVLTPGVFNSAYYEHSLLARTMGVELVEGRDLFCSGGRVWMRTTQGRRRVDVIYRRVDDDYLDPVVFRNDSYLGSPGLMTCARNGTVTIANAVGNGVADDKLVYTYVPDLIRYYLSEQPILRNVDTWRLEEPDALEEVLDRLDELVVKPVDGSGGKGLVVGPKASAAELATLKVRLREDPRGWIAQPVVQLSTVPTLVEDGLRPRHTDLRPFAVNDGESVFVLPGGLTRVALPEGELVVNSSQGGGSKDTWVLGGAVPRRAVRHQADLPQAVAQDSAVPIDSNPNDVRAQVMQQQQQGRARPRRTEVPRAEPDRGVVVLDRPLRRARGRHRPAARRARADPARGPLGGGGPGLPVAAVRDGPRAAARARRGRPRVRARHARVRPVRAVVHRGVAGVGARERPPCARDHLDRAVGVPQRDLEPAAVAHAARASARLLHVGAGARGDRRRDHGLGDVARRHLELHGARPVDRAGRHDRAAADHARARRLGGTELDHAAAVLRCARGLPADVPRGRVRRAGRRLPADRPAVPAVHRVRAEPGRGVPGQPRGHVGPGGRRRRAAAHRVRPHQPGVPPAASRCSTRCPRRWSGCSAPAPRPRTRSAAGTSRARPSTNWVGEAL